VRGVAVITEQKVLAVLNQRTGDIVWRKHLDSDLAHLISSGSQLLTVSDGKTKVQSWDVRRGSMLWEKTTKAGAPVVSLKALEDENTFLLLTRDEVTVYSKGGAAKGSLKLQEAGFKGTAFALLVGKDGGAFVLGEAENNQLCSARLNLAGAGKKLELAKVQDHGKNKKVSADLVIASDDETSAIILASMDRKSIFSLKANSNEGLEITTYALPEEALDLKSVPNAEVFYAHAKEGKRKTVIVDGESTWQVEGLVVPSNSYTIDGAKYVAAVETAGDSCSVKILNLSKRSAEVTQTYELSESSHGVAQTIFLTGYKGKQETPGFRVLLVSSDSSLSLLQQNKVVWQREEAFASVTRTAVVDFPLPSERTAEEAAPSAGFSLLDEIKMHILTLKVVLQIATEDEFGTLKAFQDSKKVVQQAHFDPSGFRKEIIALTCAGKLFALHSSDGRILWSKRIMDKEEVLVDMWVYKEHSPHKGIEIGLLSRRKGSASSDFVVVDGWNGSVLSRKQVDSASNSVMKLQPVGPMSLQGALLIDYEASKAHILVEKESDLDLLDFKSTFVFNVDEEKHELSGYLVSMPDTSSNKEAVLSLKNLWSFKLPSGHKIVGLAHPDFGSKIYSRTRVLGDRSALYKYINPNTIFLAAESRQQEGESKLSAYLIDTVTGKMLYSITHKNAQGPVQAVFHENWIVYKYWNSLGHREEVSVLELYEDEPLKNTKSISSLVLDAVFRSNETSTVSSYAPSAIRVLGQSYVLSLGMKTMAVTSSAFGITANQILVGTLSDQIYAIDKKLLDPRRPVKPSKTDKEEGLIPYNEFLPIAPQKFVTYTHHVLGLEEIQCHPTARESSVLMLAYGIDMFYTRLMPSKSFDMLEDDFSYSLLVTTILGLLTATFVVYFRVQKSNVERNWL
jgi:outer membrane protein assembly factor BamB